MRILITGITGRVGANVANSLAGAGHDVVGLVWAGDRQAAKLGLIDAEFVEGDLSSSADVARAADGAEAILHLGAAFQAGGPFTPEQYLDINVKGTFNVLEAALGLGDRLRHVIVTSTDATMEKYPPGGIDEPIREDSLPLTATSWYGYTKVLTEHLVDRYVRAESLPATVFRFANVWGAGEILDFPQFHMRHFISLLEARRDDDPAVAETLRQLQREYAGEPHLIIARDAKGRAWKKHLVEVRDIVHAYEAAVGNPRTFGKTYQIASREAVRWDRLVPHMADRLGAPHADVRLPITHVVPTYYEYDLTAARRDFGYAPTLTPEQMFDDALEYRARGDAGGRATGEIVPTRLE